jgi:ribonuclease HII
MVGAENMTTRSNLALTPKGAGERARPHLEHERQLIRAGHRLVAGIDEAGRGAWAGPVVAAAVILSPAAIKPLRGVNDSKQLSPSQRENLFQVILDHCVTHGLGQASAAEIDAVGIVPATRLAMRRALRTLSPRPNALIIDAVRLLKIKLPQDVFNFADSISLSVAAASILAKVTRDRLMIEFDTHYPVYGFAQHKGYGTQIHQDALKSTGPCEIHRRSFKPIRLMLADQLL